MKTKAKNKNALFITFEGGEGAGKTTLIDSVEKDLVSKGYQVLRTREPGGSNLSEHIRGWLLNHDFDVKVGEKAELLLFLAARAQHIEELIKPSLEQGKIVLCDRFNDSTVVYQGIARGLGLETTRQLCELVCEEVQPDLTLVLDLDPVIGLSRTKNAIKENAASGQMDRIESEKLEFHQKVHRGFKQLAAEDTERFVVIDAEQSAQQVFLEAQQAINEKLK